MAVAGRQDLIPRLCHRHNRRQHAAGAAIDQIIGSEDSGQTALMDKIADEKNRNQAINFENKMILEDAIKKLDIEDRQIVTMNFFEGLNQREISEKLNISQMQVSRKLKKAISKLFEIITKKGLSSYE